MNIKNLLISIVYILTLASFQSTFAGTKTEGPGFEVYNKENQHVFIKIMIDKKDFSASIWKTKEDEYSIKPGGKLEKDIDTSKNIDIIIYDSSKHKMLWYKLNAPEKTKYLTWNPAKNPPLYPQTGPFLGLTGKSDSGYPLNNNINQSQIELYLEIEPKLRL